MKRFLLILLLGGFGAAGCITPSWDMSEAYNMDVIVKRSPNYNDRKTPIDMLVLHYTGMETGEGALERMQDPDASVSAHYMIEEDGRVFQLVGEDKRAWHAGVARWQGDDDLNSRSIGIEIVNGGHNVPLADGSLPPYPEAQLRAVIELSQKIVARHEIPKSRVVAHSDIAPDRKEDPGEHFPWKRLAENGLGLWPDAVGGGEMAGRTFGFGETGADVEQYQRALKAIGYPLETNAKFDEQTRLVTIAFQRRWRADNVSGEADAQTQALVEHLAELTAEERAGAR